MSESASRTPSEERLAELERENAILRTKLRRSEESRANQDSVRERNDRMLHAVIAEMEQAQAELVQRHAELALTQDRLRASEQEAQQANRAKSDFLARMSHELRTPLNAIIGYTELLLEDARAEGEARDLRRIRASGRHLLSLINEVLDLSRVEAGRVQLRHEVVLVSDLMGELAAAVLPLVEQRGNTLSVEVAGDLEIHTDPTRLRQVLLNLLGNAAKFTENGSIAFTAALDGPNGVRFSVVDTGIGFSQDKIHTIFEDFGQLEGHRYGGTGLGLAIAKRLCGLLGGTISGEGREGQGARFDVWLPLVAPGAAEHAEAA